MIQKNKKYLVLSLTTIMLTLAGTIAEVEHKKTPLHYKQSDKHATKKIESDTIVQESDNDTSSDYKDNDKNNSLQERRINAIIISGNKRISTGSISTFVNYKPGEIYDPTKRRELILNLYHGLKGVRDIQIYAQPIEKELLNIHVIVEEKNSLKEIIFEGNNHLNTKEIIKNLHTNDITALDQQELKPLAQAIKKLYLEKGYQSAAIETSYSLDENKSVTATFIIKEGIQSLIKRITFTGNNNTSDKELRSIILTKEDWVLGFLDKSGSYHPERVVYGDKQQIEHYYQNRGFLYAKVTDIKTDIDPKTKNINLNFEIEEGEQYRIGTVQIQSDNQELDDTQILRQLPLVKGMLYSRESIAACIKRIELVWGNNGHIFTHVDPSIIPDEDNKTVSITFFVEPNNKVHLNRITIRGNKKTRDKVIRRRISLQEGDLLRQGLLEQSKYAIQSLGYFDQREGVLTKIKRLDNSTADVDFLVKEGKTGNFSGQLGFGGAGVDLSSPSSGVNVKIEIADTNLFGSGTDLNLSGTWAKDEQTIMFHLGQPWLFDKPILGALDIYQKRPTYAELINIDAAVNQKLTGGALTAGIISQSSYEWLQNTQFLMSLGIDSIRYQKQPIARIEPLLYQPLLDKAFTPGDFVWLSHIIDHDSRNHPMHPSQGHRWKVVSKIAIPTFGNNLGYYKLTFDTNWFTSLIDEYNLVLRVHTFLGLAIPLKNHIIPFGELFHIGGDNSVRGFLYGQIGPKFLGDTIGAQKAFFMNVELVFPITPDYSIKGVVFYDGGTGWDNPYINRTYNNFVTTNNFDYRHSVGVGIRLLKPMPIKIDWGFKIDPRSNRRDRRNGESASELHFGMSYDW